LSGQNVSSRTHAEIPVLLVARERINDVYRDYDRARPRRSRTRDAAQCYNLSAFGRISAHFVVAPEALLTHVMTANGERPNALIRAEIVYFETIGDGAVFSTGSITFCGSLSHNNYENNVSLMLENVLLRFRA